MRYWSSLGQCQSLFSQNTNNSRTWPWRLHGCFLHHPPLGSGGTSNQHSHRLILHERLEHGDSEEIILYGDFIWGLLYTHQYLSRESPVAAAEKLKRKHDAFTSPFGVCFYVDFTYKRLWQDRASQSQLSTLLHFTDLSNQYTHHCIPLPPSPLHPIYLWSSYCWKSSLRAKRTIAIMITDELFVDQWKAVYWKVKRVSGSRTVPPVAVLMKRPL